MRRFRSYFVLVGAFLMLLVVLQYPKISEASHSTFLTIFKPALTTGQNITQSVSYLQNQVFDFWNALGDLKKYRERIQNLELQLVDYDEAVKENLRLKALLEFKEDLTSKTIGARVVGWDVLTCGESRFENREEGTVGSL